MQTEETKKAIERDGEWCRWCRKNGVLTHWKTYIPGYPLYGGGGHHILGRARVDDARAIITLCSVHHHNHHNGKEPTTRQLAQLIRELYGYDLWGLWPQFIKPEG